MVSACVYLLLKLVLPPEASPPFDEMDELPPKEPLLDIKLGPRAGGGWFAKAAKNSQFTADR